MPICNEFKLLEGPTYVRGNVMIGERHQCLFNTLGDKHL